MTKKLEPFYSSDRFTSSQQNDLVLAHHPGHLRGDHFVCHPWQLPRHGGRVQESEAEDMDKLFCCLPRPGGHAGCALCDELQCQPDPSRPVAMGRGLWAVYVRCKYKIIISTLKYTITVTIIVFGMGGISVCKKLRSCNISLLFNFCFFTFLGLELAGRLLFYR